MYILRTLDISRKFYLYYPQKYQTGDRLTAVFSNSKIFHSHAAAQAIAAQSNFLEIHRL